VIQEMLLNSRMISNNLPSNSVPLLFCFFSVDFFFTLASANLQNPAGRHEVDSLHGGRGNAHAAGSGNSHWGFNSAQPHGFTRRHHLYEVSAI
jgi:hypothetical protein